MSIADTTDPADQGTPICPQCGYDLRGIASEKCPECGFDVARLGSATSEIPWLNREQIGAVRAWLLTAWRFTFVSGWLRAEMMRPPRPADARRFWMIANALFCALITAWFILRWRAEGNLDFIIRAAVPSRQFGLGQSPYADWLTYNFILPWASGASLPGVAIVVNALATIFVSGVHTYLFSPRGLDRRTADRATVLSYYLVAPFVLPALMVGIAVCAAAGFGEWTNEMLRHWTLDPLPMQAVAQIVVVLLVLNAFARLVLALHITTRCGAMYVLFAMIAWPVSIAVVVFIALSVVPWAIGVSWMALRSLW